MRKNLFAVGLLLLAGAPFFSQSTDPVILSFQRNFIRASMSTKMDVLGDASRVPSVNMTPFYADALAFARQYYPVMGNDPQLLDIAAIAANRISLYHDPSAIPVLEDTFNSISVSRVRVECIESIAILAEGNADAAGFLNAWLSAAISGSPNVAGADLKVQAACAVALGKIGDSSSFDILFRVATGSGDNELASAAQNAVNSLKAGYADKIIGKIDDKNVQQTRAAFVLAMKNQNLEPKDRGRIADSAFASAVQDIDSEASRLDAVRTDLIELSMAELTSLHWSQSASAVTKYFYARQSDYKNGKITAAQLIRVIDCMGAMQSSEAAQTLSIFLGLLNSETEQKKTYDEPLVLAVIQALGALGDKTAFDYLLYIDYLDYPDSVKKASRDAIARLQW